MQQTTTTASADTGTWAAYVRTAIGDDTQETVARRSGIHQPTISRWLRGVQPQPSAPNVVAFARAYGLPPVQALVAAGVLNADEAVA